MLVLRLRQNGLRRIESLVSLPTNRAIIVQRIVHCQSRKASTRSEINTESVRPEEAKVSDNGAVPKHVKSRWKVGAHVSAASGIENTVTNAVSIGSVDAQIGLVISKPFDPLATFIRANSFATFVKLPLRWKAPSLTPQSISKFKWRMKLHGYTSDNVLANSSYLIHLGNPDRFVYSPSLRFIVMTRRFP